MLRTGVLITLIAIVFFVADHFFKMSYFHPQKWVMLAFFSAISFLFHTLIDQGIKNKGDKFIQFYLVTVIVRIIACILFVAFFLFRGVENQGLFILNFFVLYLCFTLFEILGLYRNLRRF